MGAVRRQCSLGASSVVHCSYSCCWRGSGSYSWDSLDENKGSISASENSTVRARAIRDVLRTKCGKYQVVAFPRVGVCRVFVQCMEVSWGCLLRLLLLSRNNGSSRGCTVLPEHAQQMEGKLQIPHGNISYFLQTFLALNPLIHNPGGRGWAWYPRYQSTSSLGEHFQIMFFSCQVGNERRHPPPSASGWKMWTRGHLEMKKWCQIDWIR